MATYTGNPGNVDDNLIGTVDDDMFYALGGNDTVIGGGGNDYVEAGSGDDTVTTGSGNDEIAAILRKGSSTNLKRVKIRNIRDRAWTGKAGRNPYFILDSVDFKTLWHPVGI